MRYVQSIDFPSFFVSLQPETETGRVYPLQEFLLSRVLVRRVHHLSMPSFFCCGRSNHRYPTAVLRAADQVHHVDAAPMCSARRSCREYKCPTYVSPEFQGHLALSFSSHELQLNQLLLPLWSTTLCASLGFRGCR